MHSLVYSLADLLLTLLEYAMLFRAILSWFPGMHNSTFNMMLYSVTEPLIAPVRDLLGNIRALQGFPLDLSFLAAYMVLSMLAGLL